MSATSEIFLPGRMRRSAASSAVAAAWITSAVRPLTGALASLCTTTVVASVAMKPSMCAPRSLQIRSPPVGRLWECIRVIGQCVHHAKWRRAHPVVCTICSQSYHHRLTTVTATHILATSPSFSSVASSAEMGQKWPTTLHAAAAPAPGQGLEPSAFCDVPFDMHVCAMASLHCRRTHLFTDTQVGKATPFSMVFPLNTLPMALSSMHHMTEHDCIPQCRPLGTCRLCMFERSAQRCNVSGDSLVDGVIALLAQFHNPRARLRRSNHRCKCTWVGARAIQK